MHRLGVFQQLGSHPNDVRLRFLFLCHSYALSLLTLRYAFVMLSR